MKTSSLKFFVTGYLSKKQQNVRIKKLRLNSVPFESVLLNRIVASGIARNVN